MSFKQEWDLEVGQAFGELKVLRDKIALEAYTRVVLKTPVDTGRARSNWFVQEGDAGEEVTDSVDVSGSQAFAQASIFAADLDEVIVIYNNLPYILRLENGYSGQAPSGMVAVTVAELENFYGN